MGRRTNAEHADRVTNPVGEWPQWRGPFATGVTTDTNWNPAFPEEGPKQLWKQNVGIGFSSIAVAGGRVYTMGNQGDQDTVYCFNLENGQSVWKHSYPQELDPKYYDGGPSATPAVDGEAVYTLSRKGDLFCFDAASGRVIWSKNISQELGAEIPTWGYASSVLVRGHLAIINVGTFGTALDKTTGAVVWKTGKDASGYATPVPFSSGTGPALAIFSAGYIVGLNEADGRMLWRFPWKTDYNVNAADPIVSGQSVFIASGYGTGGGLVDFGAAKPRLAWSIKGMESHINACVLVDGHLYGIDGMADARSPKLKCLDWNTGTVRWEEPLTGTGSLIAADGKLIVLTGKGELIAARATPEKFDPIARAQVIGGKNWTAPALAQGRLLIRNAQGLLLCLDLRG